MRQKKKEAAIDNQDQMLLEKVCKELESIAPNWARAISTSKMIPLTIEVDDVTYALDTYDECIVGEAWGWTDLYEDECATCSKFGNTFYNYAIDGVLRRTVIYSLKKFIEHYRSKHGRARGGGQEQGGAREI
ncbi:MAG: hypothetical protein QXM92_01765 [Candidatus Anstonellales archaeon]